MSATGDAGRALLLGCGELGARIGLGLNAAGLDVIGVRRHADRVPDPIRGLSLDLTDEARALPDLPTDVLLVCLTADARDADGYRRTYLTGMRRGLEAVARAGLPRRALLVSSTSVCGDVEGDVDERTPARPERETARVLHEAEQLFVELVPHGTVLRPSGLYGNRTPRVVDQVRRGENPDPGRMTNRAHREDAAGAAVHLLTRDEEPEPLYLVTDDRPCPAGELRAFVAERLGLAWEAAEVEPHGKRLRNDRLRATGWVPRYPTFVEGYGPLVDAAR